MNLKRIKIKDGKTNTKKKWKFREEGPTRNQKWGILKYLYAEIFTENQSRMAYECRVKRHVSVTS